MSLSPRRHPCTGRVQRPSPFQCPLVPVVCLSVGARASDINNLTVNGWMDGWRVVARGVHAVGADLVRADAATSAAAVRREVTMLQPGRHVATADALLSSVSQQVPVNGTRL